MTRSGFAPLAGLIPLALLLGSAPALASGDFGCSPGWMLTNGSYDECNGLAFLSPANDSRINLRLLLADQGIAPVELTPSEDDAAMGYALSPFSPDALLNSWRNETESDTKPAADTGPTVGDLARQIGVQPAIGPVPAPPLPDGDASRCASNNEAAARTFLQQLIATTDLPAPERIALAKSRLDLLGTCSWDQAQADALAPAGIQSPVGRDFAAYLRGAIAFYNGAFADAVTAFGSLSASAQPWLRETGAYMVARTELNLAQANSFDDMGFPTLDKVDKTALAEAEKAFDAYLAAYPQGLYAASAQGLKRRVYWLGDDIGRLSGAYAALLSKPADADVVRALVQETDNKFLIPQRSISVTDPALLAVLDLMWMRNKGVTDDGGPAINLDTLEQEKALFTNQPALHGYLVAAYHFYVDQNWDKTLESLPDAVPTAPMGYTDFSRQTLRGLALEAKGDLAQAGTLWQALLPLAADRPLQRAQLELALAMNWERDGKLAAVFAAGSPVTTPQVRAILLRSVAGPDLLRQQAKAAAVPDDERRVALYTLLYKDLMRGQYRDFGTDLALLPPQAAAPAAEGQDTAAADPTAWGLDLDQFRWTGADAKSGYTCPSIADIAATLKTNPKSPKGLDCIGEFILRNGLDGNALDQPPPAGQLGSTPPEFPGKVYSRLDGYMQVIADGKASRDDRAYALYRAIRCFAPANANTCGSQEIPESQRKQWFRTLKSRYAETAWARELEYYW